jgi:iduronate 2-sulfatase
MILQVAPFAPTLALHPCAPLWCCVSKNFSKCQSADLASQLRAGARYFDVRVCYDAKRNVLRTEHSLYGVALADMFTQVADFVAQQPTEIVVVELRHFQVEQHYDMAPAQHQELVGILRATFREESLVRPDELATLTYAELRARGRNVVLIYNNERPSSADAEQQAFCRPRDVVSWWTNSQTISELTSRLETFAGQQQHGTRIYRLEAAITPDSNVITAGIINCIVCCFCRCLCRQRCRRPKSLREISDDVNPAILDMCTRLVREKRQIVNVVAFDNLVRMEKAIGMVSALISLNLPPGGEMERHTGTQRSTSHGGGVRSGGGGIGSSLLLLLLVLLPVVTSTSTTKHNVLHIISDDLRPELGAYGLPLRHTPTLDAIAARGTVFTRAYAQQAVCGPSRNSFLSGRRPDRSRSWNFINHFREDHPVDWTSLPGLFAKDPDFVSFGAGKIYHPKLPPAYDAAQSWSGDALPFKNPCWNTADNPNSTFQDGGLPCLFCPIDIESRIFPKRFNTSVANEFCPVDALEDTFSVDEAIALLRKVPADKFFYLAVGMHKPHLPWQYAKKDSDLHPLAAIDLPRHRLPPVDAPPIALRFTDGAIHDSVYDPISNASMRRARRAYRSAVTGMDRKLRPLLDALSSRGLENDTAIVFHSDHGWSLGEQGLWRKFTNFELATRVPLIVSVPWIEAQSARNAHPAELVDVLPTIAALSGVAIPQGEPAYDGVSLVPMLRNASAAVKRFALSQYPRRVEDPREAWKKNSIIHHNRSSFSHMGYSVRTTEWRYTEWAPWNGSSLTPVWAADASGVVAELYDHRNETVFPTNFDGNEEGVNVVTAFPDVAKRLSAVVRKEFPSKARKAK